MRNIAVIFMVIVLVFTLFGCELNNDSNIQTEQTGESEQVTTSTPTEESTEPTVSVNYRLMSDEALLRMLCEAGCFESIILGALNFPGEKAIEYYSEKFPGFEELLYRDTLMETLNGYGVKLAEAYKASSVSKDQLLGSSLEMFIITMNNHASK